MRLSNSYFYTLRENANDEDSISGNLLVRSGMIKKSSNGVYMIMPLGLKVLNNIKSIIKEEMDNKGAQELLMPSLIPEEVYINSGRREVFGNDMFSLKDRYNRNYTLGPTHEELFVNAASSKIKSYKDMPFNIYQMATKYRDEPRPRLGLIRVREFIMKDAYSFDTDLETLDASYKKMFDVYNKIFKRIGIDYRIVRADTGAMGGLLSEEFQAVTDIGEDILVLCNSCDFASNIEVCSCVNNNKSNEIEKNKEKVETINMKSIDEVSNYLNISKNECVKTLIYKANDELVACLIRGDREVNELKLSKYLNVLEVELASDDEVNKISVKGFVSPEKLNIKIIVDDEVSHMKNFVVGAGVENYHYINYNLKDIDNYEIADIRNICEEDICPKCGGSLYFKKGIEIGNTFKLGTKYSEKLGLVYLDKDNKRQYVNMGCYGIGLGRCMAAVVEQNNDEKGIIWPSSIAPYKVAIIIANMKDEEQVKCANELYNKFMENNIDVLLDDRPERIGIKFNDIDLIGIPNRIVVGKNIKDGMVEFKKRCESESKLINIKDAINEIVE